MSNCLDSAKIRSLLDGRLSNDALRMAESHLSECPDCCHKLEAASGVFEYSAIGLKSSAPIDSQNSGSKYLAGTIRQLLNGAHGETSRVANETFNDGRGSVADLLSSDREGFIGRLGTIEIRRVIGRGGMGVVFEGLDVQLNRRVAVKLMDRSRADNPDTRERFIREARAAAALDHENVVTVLSIGEANGVPYLVLQFVDGFSLAELLTKQKKLPGSEIARIGASIARGLEAAHLAGLIHRDIKPANILIEAKTKVVRVADFGLAKAAAELTTTSDGVAVGTPAFMSPEQTRAEVLDGRSDLFSLGVVLYQAATGKLPFDGDAPCVVLDQIRNAEAPPIRESAAQLGPELIAIIERLMKKSPDDRWARASDVARALDRVHQNLLSHALPSRDADEYCYASTLRRSKLKSLRWGLTAGVACAGVLFAALALSHTLARPGSGDAIIYNAADEQPPAEFAFRIDGRNLPGFASLQDVIAAAEDGDTIVIHGNGPFFSNSITTDGKRLCVHAAEGFRPVFLFADDLESHVPFIIADADLKLQGLTIDWSKADSLVLDPASSLRNSVIAAKAGTIRIDDCQVVCGNLSACVGLNSAAAEISNSHLVAPHGACFFWKPERGSTTIRQTLLEGHTACMSLFDNDNRIQSAQIEFDQSVIECEKAFQFILGDIPDQPIQVAVRRSFIDAYYMVSMHAYGHTATLTGGKRMTRTMPADLSRRLLHWTELENTYQINPDRAWISISTRPPLPNQGIRVTRAEVVTLPDWLAFWHQAASASVEAGVTFAERDRGNPFAPWQIDSVDGQFASPGTSITAWQVGDSNASHDR